MRTRAAKSHGASTSMNRCRFAAFPLISKGTTGTTTGTAASTRRSGHAGTRSRASTNTAAETTPTRTQHAPATVTAYSSIGRANPRSTTSRGSRCRYPAYGRSSESTGPSASRSRKKGPPSSAQTVARVTGPRRYQAPAVATTSTTSAATAVGRSPRARGPSPADATGDIALVRYRRTARTAATRRGVREDGPVTDSRVTRRALARRYLSAWIGFSAGGRFSQALATVMLLFAFGQPTVHALVGTAGTWAVLVTLVVLAGLSLLGQRYRIEWHGVLPLSLLAFVGYCALSVLWSEYSWVALRGFVATVCFIGLGLYLALGRDLVQVIRASGDAFRILLVVALGLEVLSGLVIDLPIPALRHPRRHRGTAARSRASAEPATSWASSPRSHSSPSWSSSSPGR